MPEIGNKRHRKGLGLKRVSLAILLSMMVLGATAVGPALNGDEDLGKIVGDKPPPNADQDGADEADGKVDPNWTPEASLPFTEEEERKRGELQLRYKDDNTGLNIDSIEPEAGPITGETRVLVHGGPFEDMTLLYPRPKCKFGSNDRIVGATYVKCHTRPLSMDDWEGKSKDKKSWCLQCDNSPPVGKPQITPLMISLTGDFTDSNDSEPFRYYNNTRVYAIYPRYGPKDGGTVVQVWGDNFLNYDENLRCNFGTKSVKAVFKSSTYIICKAPFSDNTNKPISFSVSMNKQQQSRDDHTYWFYSNPILAKLEPNYGPDSGGNEIILMGSSMHPFVDESRIDNANDTFCIFSDLNVKTPARFINATKMACVAPATFDGISVTGVDFTLNNQNYTDDDVPYYYYKPPKIYDMQPREGPTKGGTHVRIFAAEFKKNKHILCVFDGIKTRAKLINPSEIECVSPKWPESKEIPVWVIYEEDGDKSRSTSLPFLYYETPEVHSLEPPCGPTYGYTQIMVKGKNFINMGLNKAACIFNGRKAMNVTIIDEHTLYCSSPPLTRSESLMPYLDMRHTVEVTLNGAETTDNKIKFHYYPDPEINQVLDSNLGPVQGGTSSTLNGRGFKHENVCNLKIRYGALETTPEILKDTQVKTVSPRVSVPDAVVLAPSGNGQNYGADLTLHYRDPENTFTYYQNMFVHDLHPQAGPTTGKTRVEISGIGFTQFKNDNGTIRYDQPLYAKFVESVTGKDIGSIMTITEIDNDSFVFYTPKAAVGTTANLMLSFNQQQWQAVIPNEKQYTYMYYNAPIVEAITPQYGPVKSPNNEKAIISGRNFECPDGASTCECFVRFGDIDFGTVMTGQVLSYTQIEVHIPKYTKPDILAVDISMNGRDYTNDKVTYGFFDAFVLDVAPRLISKRGGTKLSIRGFGFVNSGSSEIATKFGSKNGALDCNRASPCTVPAKFLDKHTIQAESLPQNSVTYTSNGKSISEDPMTVEVSVYGNSFTENEIEVYYIYDPEYRKINRSSVPRNMQVPLLIETDFFWDRNDKEMFFKFANFTCRFTLNDTKVTTQGRMETIPLGSSYSKHGEKPPLPDHVVCPSPKMEQIGMGKLEVSANGVDYEGAGFAFEFEETADVYRIAPQSGPKDSASRIKFIGGGLKSNSQLYAKIGNYHLEPINRELVGPQVWNQDEYLQSMLMTNNDLRQFKAVQHHLDDKQSIQSLQIRTIETPNAAKTHGGPVFMSVGQVIQLDVVGEKPGRLLDDAVQADPDAAQPDASQPVAGAADVSTASAPSTTSSSTPSVNSASADQAPTSTVDTKKADVDNTGGQKISAGMNAGTKPLQTHSAPKPKIGTPGDRYLFTESPVEFYYYHQPKVVKVQPTQGLTKGGTPIEVSGAWFDEKLDYGVIPYCMIGDKINRAIYFSTVRIVCYSPPNDNIAAALPVKVSLNGVDFVDSGFTFSYYTEPVLSGLLPASGPYEGGTQVFLKGNLFSNITDSNVVKCRFMLKNGTAGFRETLPKYMPAFYIDKTTMMCVTPNGFIGGDRVFVQLTFNDMDYSPQQDHMVFSYYAIFGAFPHSGPANGFNEVILVRGAGLNVANTTFCHLNKTEIAPVTISETLIECPMTLPDKDPLITGYVDLGLNFDGFFNDFGQFYYYTQIDFGVIEPTYGPNEGEGEIYFTGENFREDFQGVEIGCKLGDAIGQGEITGPNSIKCVVEEMQLVEEGEGLVVKLALNSYSWVGGAQGDILYRPYGITNIQPSSGPYDGFTDVRISGKGFNAEYAEKGRCRFGTESNFAIIEADVLDYSQMICRSPEEFMLPEGADQLFSVPFSIAFGEEEFKPYTLGTHRYRFYTDPRLELAIPEEVRIGKFAEIYVYAYEDTPFFEPLPSRNGDLTGVLCNFEEFGTSMGMYINETTVMCVTPHVQGRPEDYGRETVQVTVAMNGQDFSEANSDAYVTFVGTGGGAGIIKILMFILLLALLILAIIYLCMNMAARPKRQSDAAYTANDDLFQARQTFATQKNNNPDVARLSQSRQLR